MALVKTAVLLFAAPATGPLNLRERIWYDHYFFHPMTGQNGYWITQTDGERVLHGQVFDWVFDPGGLPDFSKRQLTADHAIWTYEQAQGVDFGSFDVVVVVLGIGKATPSNGGSTGAKSKNRYHNAVVCRIGDRFDFVAHELGHALGLGHSFGTNPVPVEGDNPGGYGHPFCIMSALLYGGTAAAFDPPQPKDNTPEYRFLGPSLNGLTARAKGWIDAHVMNLAASAQADFTLRARQWLGRMTESPQAIEILAADGSNWVVDFYVPEGWDRAQPGPAVVLTQGRGGRAHMHYSEANGGTYITHARMPVTFGAVGASLAAGAFRVHLLEYNATTREVKVRIRRGPGSSPFVVIGSKVDALGAPRLVESGVTTWEPGEELCHTGTWRWDKFEHSQEAVVEATYELGAPGMQALWTVQGRPLPVTGPLKLSAFTVTVADPKFQNAQQSKNVELGFLVEPLPNGSRLKLRNRPQDETFKLRVDVTLSNTVGAGSEVTWVDFKGREYVYEQRFYEQRDACIGRFIDIGKKYRPVKVVPFPQLKDQIDPVLHERLDGWLEALADTWERGEMEVYEQGVRALSREIGVPDLGLRVLSVQEAYSPPRIQHEIAPPAPADLAAAVMGGLEQSESQGSRSRRLAGFLLAGAAGVALGYLWASRRS